MAWCDIHQCPLIVCESIHVPSTEESAVDEIAKCFVGLDYNDLSYLETQIYAVLERHGCLVRVGDIIRERS